MYIYLYLYLIIPQQNYSHKYQYFKKNFFLKEYFSIIFQIFNHLLKLPRPIEEATPRIIQ